MRLGAARITATILLSLGAIEGQARLSIDRLEFQQYEDGPSLPANYEFLPGETVWLSCRMGGFHTVQEDNERHVKLSWQLRITDPADVLIDRPLEGKIEDRLFAEDKEWRPKFNVSFQIPPFAVGGIYKIPVRAKDELNGSEVSRILEFSVKAPALFAAETLVIRNFRFLRNEEDVQALRPAVYRPGNTLWAKFDIAGYLLTPGNHKFSVSYGLAILGPDGKQVFSQEDAATEEKESFYPQRWVPGGLSLNLDKNVSLASYTLVVLVRDKSKNETTELRELFEVQ